MQIPQGGDHRTKEVRQAVRSGDLVMVRRQRWLVVDVRSYEQCRLVTLRGIGSQNNRVLRRFLLPFDNMNPIEDQASIRFVSGRRWRRALRACLAEHAPPGSLRSGRKARMDLLPHQLEPALAIVRGHGCRVLIADDVGLGKTVQAGLIISELVNRAAVERVLVLTPAGLREQWVREISERFGLAATVVDFRDVRQRASDLAVGINPWSTVPIAVASVDYVKRPEVLHAVLACRWDIVAVDEAHGVARGSDRHDAVAALAGRASYVLLLTATPHSGDPQAFQSLCRLGAHNDPILIFRRSRADVRLKSGRRVHLLLVRSSDAEAQMHRALAKLASAIRAERGWDTTWLALSVLHKRAYSSAHSLEQSVERRRAALSGDTTGPSSQLPLPLSDSRGEFDSGDEPPGWATSLFLADEGVEGQLLRDLAAAARTAAAGETKFAAVLRLLRRIPESIVIFTEYRDTLRRLHDHLNEPASILHGGLSREERRTALDDFTAGRRRLLLATDAAGEGLNLHHHCRFVINLELPWNPMRLEQRIGRVDRIGQQRRVHVFHLVARDTGEHLVLGRLKARIARARRDVATADPVTNEEERTAKLVVAGIDDDASFEIAHARPEAASPERLSIRLEPEATAETERLRWARLMSHQGDEVALAMLETTGGWATRAKLGATRRRIGRRLLTIFRVDYEDGNGVLPASVLVPLRVTLNEGGWRSPCVALQSARDVLRDVVDRFAAQQGFEIEESGRAIAAPRIVREQSIAAAVDAATDHEWQPGLFDRRAESEWATARACFAEALDDLNRRVRTSELSASRLVRPGRLLLALVP